MNLSGFDAIMMICCGVHCTENKSVEIRKKIEEELDKHGLKDKVFIFFNGCFGLCRKGPVIEIIDGYFVKTTYIGAKIEDVKELVDSHFIKHIQLDRLLLKESEIGKK